MAIGTTAAIIGSAVVGAGASALSASKNSKAIGKATDAQTQGNREALAAQERARAENVRLQQPLYNAGMPAVFARNALLGLGGTAPQNVQQPQVQPNALSQFAGGQMPAGYGYGMVEGASGPFQRDMVPNTGSNRMAWQSQISQGGLPYPAFGNQVVPQTQAVPQGTVNSGMTSQQAAEDAFTNFRNSTGYQFRLGEGMNALNSGYAGAGVLQSGAAMKDAVRYGQDFASNEFGRYFGMLGEQQNLATGAANALSGVNTTYANNAGNLAIAQGQNLANSAVARANNSNAMIGGIAGGFSNALGAFAFPGGR